MELRITKVDPLFINLRWVCLAAARNDAARPALELLHVLKTADGLQFTCCDGFRVHRFTIKKDARFKCGDQCLYEIDRITKSELILTKGTDERQYPNVDGVIPDNTDNAKSITFKYADGGASIHAVFAAATRLLDPKWSLDAGLFKEMLSADIIGKAVTLKVHATRNTSYTIIETADLMGLLMSIEIKSDGLIIEPEDDLLS